MAARNLGDVTRLTVPDLVEAKEYLAAERERTKGANPLDPFIYPGPAAFARILAVFEPLVEVQARRYPRLFHKLKAAGLEGVWEAILNFRPRDGQWNQGWQFSLLKFVATAVQWRTNDAVADESPFRPGQWQA